MGGCQRVQIHLEVCEVAEVSWEVETHHFGRKGGLHASQSISRYCDTISTLTGEMRMVVESRVAGLNLWDFVVACVGAESMPSGECS